MSNAPSGSRPFSVLRRAFEAPPAREAIGRGECIGAEVGAAQQAKVAKGRGIAHLDVRLRELLEACPGGEAEAIGPIRWSTPS